VCYDSEAEGLFASSWNLGEGASRRTHNTTQKNLFYVFILFYIPFDVGCPQGSPVQEAVLEDLLKQFNCKQILFDRRSFSGRN
jgi:hypothetical protein